MDVEKKILGELNGEVSTLASTSTLSPIIPLSCYTKATHAALVFLGLREYLNQTFNLYIEKRYGGFSQDQMQHI